MRGDWRGWRFLLLLRCYFAPLLALVGLVVSRCRIAVVVSSFNPEVTDGLLRGALDVLQHHAGIGLPAARLWEFYVTDVTGSLAAALCATAILSITGSVGMLQPWSNTANQERIVDRFFMHGSRFRGFDSIGPRSERVDGGNVLGDVLGGDMLGTVSARVLLPPPSRCRRGPIST